MIDQKNFRPQQTIARPVSVDGFGFWSGLNNTVEFRPADPDAGVTFIRADLSGQPQIAARIDNQADALRRTTLVAGHASVEMVEHLLAALAGLQIDNCEVRVTSAEMPGFDGSSMAFVDALSQTGIVVQQAARKAIVIDETFRIGDEDSWIEARPVDDNSAAAGQLYLSYELDYQQHQQIGKQDIRVDINPGNFRRELAGARTFLLQHEADWLRNQGIGRRVTYRDVLVFGENGPIDNTLHFDNECVRHKTLDVLGDLALIGCDVVGEIVAHRSGHILNASMVRELIRRYIAVEESPGSSRKAA